jgi:stage II sporulation protein P
VRGSSRLAAWVLAALLCGTPVAFGADPPEGSPMTLVTADGRPLLTTGLRIQSGDSFVDSAGDWWQVSSVGGTRAVAHRIAKLAGLPPRRRPGRVPRRQPAAPALPPHQEAGLRGGQPAVDVVIYHSHSDESYIPTDGSDSSPDKGGIYQVGASLAAALQARGLTVMQSPENHNPHDHEAYLRSRRTVLAALRQRSPRALFDVHRDAAPAAEYRFTAGGQALSRVMIVIGTANPGHGANLAFAQQVKARADGLQPGLVKGIYLGHGTYNQDTSIRNLLLEAGSEQVPREEAEAGIALLAAAIDLVLKEPGAASRSESAAAWHTIAWSVGVTLVAAAAWMALISGGPRPALARLGQWVRQWKQPTRRR